MASPVAAADLPEQAGIFAQFMGKNIFCKRFRSVPAGNPFQQVAVRELGSGMIPGNLVASLLVCEKD